MTVFDYKKQNKKLLTLLERNLPTVFIFVFQLLICTITLLKLTISLMIVFD